MDKCIKCGKILDGDEIGLTKKIINRAATEYMCIHCLAKKFNVTEELLFKKIQDFKKQGCLLFAD